jgi:hypothetical protein
MTPSPHNVPVRVSLLAAVLVTACLSAWAQGEDPPARAGRLSVADGNVSLEPAGMSDWTAAGLNRPLTTGDRLWTDQDSRAEVDFGDAVVRLGPFTGFAFLNLDDSIAQMQLSAGTLIVRVRNLRTNQIYEVDTPNLAVTLVEPGEYRLEVGPSGTSTLVRVTEGAAEASAGGQTFVVNNQQAVNFSGTQSLAYQNVAVGVPDALDNWSSARERGLEDSNSREYVAEDLPGTQDLDDNGHWESAPEYGYVWIPTVVVVNWAPYRYGHWCWVAPWGWTWVDDARWGYAPSHYGRWARWNNAWAWVPGPRRARPVYAPALVGWVHGPGFGGSTAFGTNVGWFPLAPREVYEPPYRVSPGDARNTQVVNPKAGVASGGAPARYVNSMGGAVTSVSQDVFVSGERVGTRTLHVAPAVLAGSAVSASAPAIAPVRQSVLGPTGGRVTRPPVPLVNRPVVAFTVPPRSQVPFDQQLEAIQANGGRPLTRPDLARLPASAGAPSVRLVASGATAPRSLTPRAQPGTLPATAAPAEPTLAERARALQSGPVSASPRAPYAPAPAVATGVQATAPPTAVPPAPLERAPSASASSPSVPQRVSPPTPPPERATTVTGGTLYHTQPMVPPPAHPAASSPAEVLNRGAPAPETPHYRSAPVAPLAAPPSQPAPSAAPAAHPPPAAAAHPSSPPAAPQSRNAQPPAHDTNTRPQ